MINKITLEKIKEEVKSDLKILVEKLDIDTLSTFNKGYLSYKENPYKSFILNEISVWNKIIDFYAFRRGNMEGGILDIGSFIPYYPVVLKKLGYQVEVIEKIDLYGSSYTPILEYLSQQGIKLHNIDIIKDSTRLLPKGYDILLIALLEHLNGSPQELINKIKSLMNQDSLLYIHVPNVCKLNNVITMLRGKSPLPTYRDYYFSGYPFEGHNREMTLEELILLCKFSSLEIVERGYVIKYIDDLPIKNKILNSVKMMFPKYSDSVYVVSRKK